VAGLALKEEDARIGGHFLLRVCATVRAGENGARDYVHRFSRDAQR
jgi:hypothetical protein